MILIDAEHVDKVFTSKSIYDILTTLNVISNNPHKVEYKTDEEYIKSFWLENPFDEENGSVTWKNTVGNMRYRARTYYDKDNKVYVVGVSSREDNRKVKSFCEWSESNGIKLDCTKYSLEELNKPMTKEEFIFGM